MMLYLPVVLAWSLWSAWGERCADIGPTQISMVCTSAALLGPAQSGPGALSAEVWMQPAPNGSGYAAVVLNGDPAADNRYASAAIAQQLDPFADLVEPWGVLLAQMPSHVNAYMLGPAPPGWHQLSVAYDGAGIAEACVDGRCERVRVELPSWQPSLLCAGVAPNTPGANPATCLFRNVVMQ